MKNSRVAVATGYAVLFFLFASGMSGCSGQSESSGQAGGKVETVPQEPDDYAENFVGEWKSVESEGRNHMIFIRNGENFIMQEGEKTAPGIYDKENKVIKINAAVPFDVMYLENEDMLLVTGGGKYTKVVKSKD